MCTFDRGFNSDVAMPLSTFASSLTSICLVCLTSLSKAVVHKTRKGKFKNFLFIYIY